MGPPAAAIGIDLGTTYSCVAVWKNERIEIITNDHGNRTTPSCVAFTDAERLIGDGAINQITTNPSNTVFAQLPAVLHFFHLNIYVQFFFNMGYLTCV